MWWQLLLLGLLCASWELAVGGCSQCPKAFDAAVSKQQAQESFACPARVLREEGHGSLKPLFIEWQLRYNINYLPSEAETRYPIWEVNVRGIIDINFNNGRSDWQGFTAYTGLTVQEARNRLLFRKPAPVAPNPDPDAPLVPNDLLPETVDWEAAGKLTPVKDQGNCGSCWAFTGIAAIEARLKIQTGLDYDLSEQQVIDCHPTAWACWGGWLDAVMSFATKTPIVSAVAYPYTVGGCYDPAEDTNNCFANRCPTDLCKVCRAPTNNKVQVTLNSTGYVRTPTGAKDNLMLAVAQNGPTAVAMKVQDDFFQYVGGIYNKPEGSCGPTDAVDHAVLVVGYDRRKPNPYWKIRNTWGPNWGEGGYFRMSMIDGSIGPCQIYVYGGYYPTTAIVNGAVPGTSSPPPPPPPPSPPPSSVGTAPLMLVRGKLDSIGVPSLSEGRLEVQHQNQWGFVCTIGFTQSSANVACVQLNKGSLGYATAPSVYGAADSSLPSWMNNVQCKGTEKRLQDCPFSGFGNSPCSPTQAVGVKCGYYQLRLVYARGTPAASRVYRVEALFNQQWGTLCSRSFKATDARVLCRSAGLGNTGRVVALSASSSPPQGVVNQPIWMDGPGCKGTEKAVPLCKQTKLVGQQSCGADHSKDVGVRCLGPAPAPAPKKLRPKIVAV